MELRLPESIAVNTQEILFFKAFVQGMLNRRAVGSLRYGRVRSEQKYLTRLKKELKAYCKTGNLEQLLNIAVYCYLEAYAPENNKFHWDPTVDSVTRKSHDKP